MHCILVTGIPAAGKSTLAEILSKELELPLISKDQIKEILFDEVGFNSRQAKVQLGNASMCIMYYIASQLMKLGQPFILENNFEYVSKKGLLQLMNQYSYDALTITLTGDYKTIYARFIERNSSPERHRGHIINDCYPEKTPRTIDELKKSFLSYENFVDAIKTRGMDDFVATKSRIVVDVTDFSKIDTTQIVQKVKQWKEDRSDD